MVLDAAKGKVERKNKKMGFFAPDYAV